MLRVFTGHQVETREVRARMELPMVRAVLETGVDRNSVMKVIERRLRTTGMGGYCNSIQLLKHKGKALSFDKLVLQIYSNEPPTHY